MSCVFLTKLGCSSGRAKWLRLEQRPFNYFVARTHIARYTEGPARTHVHATVYVRSHLVAGIAKVRPLMHVRVSVYTCPSSLLKLRSSRKLLTRNHRRLFSLLWRLFETTISFGIVAFHRSSSTFMSVLFEPMRDTYYFQLNPIRFSIIILFYQLLEIGTFVFFSFYSYIICHVNRYFEIRLVTFLAQMR